MIQCKNAAFGYDGKKVVTDLSFNLPSGAYLCITGENGSGKSTLIKGISGIKKPLEGELTVNAHPSDVGYMPQLSEVQQGFPAGVYEVVLSGFAGSLGKRLFYSAEHKAQALSNMEKMKVADLKNKSFSELSGGQRQRVLLARALCGAKKLLVLDEPSASLDASVTAELYSAVHEINKSGMTIVMVSHDIKNSLCFASHVLQLDNSQAFFGSCDEYKNYLRRGGDLS